MALLSILGTVVALFLLLLIVKSLLPKRMQEQFCVLCSAISLTWLCLLILSWIGRFEDRILLALLMGTSVTGIYYLADAKLESLRLFRLPFFLTLLTVAYSLVAWELMEAGPYLFLLALWLLFGLISMYRTSKRMKKLVDRIVECCKRW